jgi:hypothetical protein
MPGERSNRQAQGSHFAAKERLYEFRIADGEEISPQSRKERRKMHHTGTEIVIY